MKKVLTVASRAGELAIAQTEIVCAALRKAVPGVEVAIKKIATAGDRDRRTTLWELKETGFFTSQLEDALLAGQADFAVHSFKDLPTKQRDGLTIAAVCDRKFPEDCLVSSKRIGTIDQLPKGAKIGTSSLRRLVQIKRLRPDVVCLPTRGNVATRLRKLRAGQFDAIILARAGLERLGLANEISMCFDPSDFIPAPAQGALAVQARTDDPDLIKLLAVIDDRNARLAAFAERAVFTALNCGCHAPAGAFAVISADAITISAFLCDPAGQNFIRRRLSGSIANADRLARQIAADILDNRPA